MKGQEGTTGSAHSWISSFLQFESLGLTNVTEKLKSHLCVKYKLHQGESAGCLHRLENKSTKEITFFHTDNLKQLEPAGEEHGLRFNPSGHVTNFP